MSPQDVTAVSLGKGASHWSTDKQPTVCSVHYIIQWKHQDLMNDKIRNDGLKSEGRELK